MTDHNVTVEIEEMDEEQMEQERARIYDRPGGDDA